MIAHAALLVLVTTTGLLLTPSDGRSVQPKRSTCTPQWVSGVGVPGATWEVNALAEFDDGNGPALYAGGLFTHIGGVAASGVARRDGTTWAPLGAGVGGGWVRNVAALVVFDDGSGPALYAGGTFTTAGGQPAARIARWDGSVWSALGSGVGSISSDRVADIAVFDDGTGPALYVAGRFTVAGGGEALHMARWDGATWSAVGGGMNGAVHALTVYDAGSGSALYAGGSFTSAGGIAANRVARWDGTAWEPLGNGITGIVGSVDVLLGHNDGSGWALYAGGSFTSGAARQIARWNGSTWGPVGGGIGMPTGWVYTLCRFDEGLGTGAALFAGGDFTNAGGVTASRGARWDGSAWSSRGSGLLGPGGDFASSMIATDDGTGPVFFIGGSFESAGGMPAFFIAEWHGCFSDCNGNGLSDAFDIATGISEDCTGTGIPDECEISLGLVYDCDGDGVPDSCQIFADPTLDMNGDGYLDACSLALGDFTLDGAVDMHDLLVLLSIWGSVDPPFGDLDGNGTVGSGDLLILLANWGPYMP